MIHHIFKSAKFHFYSAIFKVLSKNAFNIRKKQQQQQQQQQQKQANNNHEKL